MISNLTKLENVFLKSHVEMGIRLVALNKGPQCAINEIKFLPKNAAMRVEIFRTAIQNV